MQGIGATSDSSGLEAVCRAALEAVDATRITVWCRGAAAATLSPYVTVAGPPADPSADSANFVGWADTPIADLPPFAEALSGRHAVVVGDPGSGGGRLAELARQTGVGSMHCEPLHRNVPLGVLLIQPSEAVADPAGLAAVRILTASATSWLARRSRSGRSPDHDVFLELAEAAMSLSPFDVLRLACRRLAQVLRVRRGTIFSEDEAGVVYVRMSETADGVFDDAGWRRLRSAEEPLPLVQRVLASGRPAWAEEPSSELIGPRWSQGLKVAAAIAVPIGERGVLVLDTDHPWQFGRDDVYLLIAAAAQLGGAAREARGQRELVEQEATTAALRQLLETGVSACSPMEAAEAIAGTAARILGLPTACAYLVDDAGRISEVATVGVAADLAEALRAGLVGKPAAASPVWRRTVEGPEAGPDLIADTTVAGVVRRGGVAEVLGWRSLATIPLLSSDGPLGLVLSGDSRPRKRWRRGDRELLARLALEGAVVVDNARLREAERHEASHDSLTGLLNRRAFSERFQRALAVAARGDASVAVLVLDLDRFKEVNDHLGHHFGDELLVEVARRLRAQLREEDVIARMGGDEFALILTTDGDRVAAEAVAVRLEKALGDPMELGDHALRVDASIGVAFCPEQGEDVDTLLQRADLAMYAAKRSGRGHEVYRPGMEARTVGEFGLLGELRQALQGGEELLLLYQPKLDLKTGRAVGVEALARWRHPRHGLLGADSFVPIAEETGLVRALTAWAVPEALAQLRRWRETGANLRMAVNVSARDVYDPDIATRVAGWLAAAGLPGACVVIEVTEGTLMADSAQTRAALERLRALGVQVSLDDFGTGYSSLAYLESLSVDEIKLDRQFLRLDRSGRSVLRSIIALGHDLGMRVVAEGVENAEQFQWLVDAGCDEAQGNFFTAPLDAEALIEWVAPRLSPRVPGALSGTV